MIDGRYQILSLGAGVQSSTIALMSEHGDLPSLDAAVFADTGAEPKAVYQWLEWLTRKLTFPIYCVGKEKSISTVATTFRRKPDGSQYVQTMIPAFTKNTDGTTGMMPRQCTREFKVRPVARKVKEIAQIKRGEKNVKVDLWMGISMDEVQRMKTAADPWQNNQYPLIDLRMKRQDCLRWMADNDYPEPPRSACIFCPFKANREWMDLDPSEFEKACKIDEEYRRLKMLCLPGGPVPYVHRSCVPLRDVDLHNSNQPELNLFNNECEGMCGI